MHPEPDATRTQVAARAPKRPVPSHRFWLALAIALASDAVQLAVFPFFVEGAASPWNDALDAVVALSLTLLMGWHWAFLPSLVAELVPGIVVVPTWTAAVLVVGWIGRFRGGRASPAGSLAVQSVEPEKPH
jgi:hypothetical protein